MDTDASMQVFKDFQRHLRIWEFKILLRILIYRTLWQSVCMNLMGFHNWIFGYWAILALFMARASVDSTFPSPFGGTFYKDCFEGSSVYIRNLNYFWFRILPPVWISHRLHTEPDGSWLWFYCMIFLNLLTDIDCFLPKNSHWKNFKGNFRRNGLFKYKYNNII